LRLSGWTLQLGVPPLPTRLVAGLFILKHMHNLSDQALCERWVENPYFQYFCGEVLRVTAFQVEPVRLFPICFPERNSGSAWRQKGS
jgi:hypothetical protein